MISIEVRDRAYQDALKSGLVHKVAAEVLHIFYRMDEPMTSLMVQREYCRIFKDRSIRTIGARVTELKQIGALVEVYAAKCEITNRQATYLEIAKDCSGLKKRTTGKAGVTKKLKARVKYLESQVIRLGGSL